jgi:hypothetical protein
MPDQVWLLTDSMILLATRLCRARACGMQPRHGMAGAPLRCRDCPLEDVAELWDSTVHQHGAGHA